jgi:23S rRNA pseudouridine1911/1915/1917 synthase
VTDDAPGPRSFVVGAGEAGRADRVVAARFPEASRRRLADLFAAGAVRVDGRRVKKGDLIAAGAEVTLDAAPAADADLRPVPDPAAAARLAVLHADDELVVVAKPAGMPSQPLRPGELGTAAGGLAHLYPECRAIGDDPRDGGLVHRLDVGTSGALAAARTPVAWRRLRAAFGAGEVDKTYLALTGAAPVARASDLPLAQRGRRVVVDYAAGLPAHTAFEVARRVGPWWLVRCRATTGRMHQVRAHLAEVGAPIAGDARYGGPPLPDGAGFFLHAERLVVPGAGGPIAVDAPLPDDKRALLERLAAEAGPTPAGPAGTG